MSHRAEPQDLIEFPVQSSQFPVGALFPADFFRSRDDFGEGGRAGAPRRFTWR